MSAEGVISLRPLTEDDIGERYVRWMNDRDVARFLEARHGRHTPDSLREFLRDHPDEMFAILRNGEHVGNLRLAINWRHRTAELGILIGEASARGKGYGTQAINHATERAFSLGVRKVTAGAYISNMASGRAFNRAGFRLEAYRQAQYLLDGKPEDEALMCKFAPAKP
jgi:[ribosomal protein S5]-alanine N-acetyltransferase